MKKLRPAKLLASAPPREALILLAFLGATAVMTWPWVTRLRDAVADPGDPYMIAWALWWDYHQTFNDPLNLFHANVFYPHRYTLAFSEHDYGIAVLFFPLFALGLRPLTVHSVATFCGFAFCGYSAFRLARTLTNSDGAALIAGLFFAFVPYRFNLLGHLHYLFAGWLPLTLEALVLFARGPTRRRAAWLGVSLVMNALTCVTWMVLSLAPLSLSLAYLVARYRLTKEGAFWVRGGAAVALSALAALPFLLPYRYASELYGFGWKREEAISNSPPAVSWLDAERRNKLWRGFGANLGGTAPLFPGLLPLLLALAAVYLPARRTRHRDTTHEGPPANDSDEPDGRTNPDLPAADVSHDDVARNVNAGRGGLLLSLDALAVAAAVAALLVAGYAGTKTPAGVLSGVLNSDRALLVCFAALSARLSVAYPRWLPADAKNLRETIRTSRRGDAFWLGWLWAAVGFLTSLGMNGFLFRFLYDNFFLFRTQRIPARAAMLAYVGLALLAGFGASRLAARFATRAGEGSARRRSLAVYAALSLALMFELRAAPLAFVRGAVAADEVTLRLKATPMRGGLVELPAGRDRGHEHLYMLRAADHARPLVNATSSFVPPLPLEIESLTSAGPVPERLLDVLEGVPVSYVVVRNALVAPERRADYESFLARAVESGRLRFVRRFDERDDLYAVTKTEPGARQEAPLPFSSTPREWAALLAEDPVYLLGQFEEWSEAVYRFHLATFGRMPRFAELLPDVRAVASGVFAGVEGQEERLRANVDEFAREWVGRERFAREYASEPDARYVERLFANAGLAPTPGEHDALVEGLRNMTETRASVLRKIVGRPDFARRERGRAYVLLHYFGYLRRDPDAPPDNDLDGFNFWVRELEITGDPRRVTKGFMESPERAERRK